MQSLNPRGVGQTIRWPNHLVPLAPCACISTLNVMHPYPLPLFTVNPYPRRTTEPQLTALCPTPELQEIRTYIHHPSICVQSYLPTNVHTYIHTYIHLTRYIKGVRILAQNPPIEYMHVRTYIHTHTPLGDQTRRKPKNAVGSQAMRIAASFTHFVDRGFMYVHTS